MRCTWRLLRSGPRSLVALVVAGTSTGSAWVGAARRRCNDAHLRLDDFTKAGQVFDVLGEVVAGVDRDERCGDRRVSSRSSGWYLLDRPDWG